MSQGKVNTANGYIYYGDISYIDDTSGTLAFSAKPVVTATYRSSSTLFDPPSTNNPDAVITVVATTNSKFTYRVFGATEPLDNFFYINWMAIGPK